MRRILLLITDLQIGGTPTVVRELACRLNRAGGAAVEVACLSPWGPVADQLRQAGVAVHALNARRSRDLPQIASRLVKFVRQQRFDTVFSFLVHANTVAAMASLFLRDVRFIQSIQTTQPNPWWHWQLQRLAHHAAERIAVPSESVATVAGQWSRIAREKIEVIPNAIEPGEWERSTVATEVGMATDAPVPVGFIGRLDPIKRVPHLIDAIPTFEMVMKRPVHVHLYGEGSDRGRIEAHIARQGLADKVTLHGAIARPQDALAKLAVLVLPSIAEGFGLVLIEAMASGVPVVAMRVPGPIDVIRDGQTGLLVDPDSSADLALAVTRVIEDAELRERLIRNGLTDVAQRFSWTTVLGQYQRLLGVTPDLTI